MKILKKILIGLGTTAIIGGGIVGADLLQEKTIDEKIESLPISENLKTDLSTLSNTEKVLVEPLLIEQINYKKIEKDGKYKTVQKMVDGDMEYWVDEYNAPPYDESGKGYQIYIKNKEGLVKSFGEGKESTERSFDWKNLKQP